MSTIRQIVWMLEIRIYCTDYIYWYGLYSTDY